MSRVSHAWIAMLRQNRLHNFINAFRSLGVENTDDLLDVFNDDLLSLGMTKIQRNRFNRMCSELRGDDKTTDSILPRGILSPTSNNSTSTNSQDIQSPHTFHQGQCQQLESGLSSSDVWSPPAIGQGLHRPIETGLSSHNVLTSPSIRQDHHQPMISPNVQSSQAIGQSLHRPIETGLSSHNVLTSPSIRQDNHQPMISPNVQSSQAIGQSLHRSIESNLSSHDVLTSPSIRQDHHQPMISSNVQSSQAIGQSLHRPIESGLSSHDVLSSSAIGQDHQPLKASLISPNVQSSSAIGQDIHQPIESGLSSHNVLTSSAIGQDHQPLKASFISPNVQSSSAIGQDLHRPIESGLSSHNILTSSANGQDHQPLKASLISPNVQSSQAIGQDLHQPIESGLSSHNVLTSSAIGQDHQPLKASLISPNVQSSQAIGQDLHRPIESGLSSHNVLTSSAIGQDHQPRKASLISPNVQSSPAIGQDLHRPIESGLSSHNVLTSPAIWQDHQPMKASFISPNVQFSPAIGQALHQSIKSSLSIHDVKSCPASGQDLHQPIASDSSSHDTKYSSAVEQDQSQSLESSLCLCDVKSPAIVEQGLHQPMESDLSLPDIQLPPSIVHCPMDQSDEQSGQTGFQLSDFSVNAHDQSHKKSPDHLTSDQSDCQFLYQTVACQLKPTHSNCEQYVIFYKTFDCLLKTVSRKIDGLDPDKHTVDYLICLLSKVDPLTEDCEVQIYTAEGIPITCDVFLNKWTLKKRKIESGSVLFVIFTKTGLRDMTLITEEKLDHEVGMAILYVHIMMGDTYKVHVDLANDTVLTLKRKIYSATGIETSCQRLRLDDCSWKNSDDDSLDKHGVVDGQTIMVALSSLTCDNYVSKSRQFDADINTYTEQTLTGLAVFYSVLNVVISHNHSKINNKNVLGFVRKLTAFPPLVASLDLQLHQRNMNFAQKVCLVEGLYFLFRRLLPKPGTDGKDGVLDKCVFEHSASCWAYILTNANASDGASEVYKTIDLACPISCARLMEPVRINGIEEICEKAVVVKKIQDGDKVCGIVVPPSVLANVNPASDIERLLLCHPYSTTLCYVWQKPKNCLYELKDIKQESLIKMEEQILSFDYLKLYPPLKLKNPMNVPSPCLTLNSNATMVVYTGMGKDVGHSLHLYDSVKQSTQIIQADELALSLRNYPFSAVSCTKEVGKGNFTREPTEAIVVLFDTSSSMNTSCFGETMKRIDSIKQLFHAFANRSMAYNFAHIIGLTEFSSAVTVVDKCNESFEHFKNKVDNLYAYGRTLMYDAIVEGISQLNVIGKKYPNCKKRLLCLSDGLDIGSSTTLLMAAKALQISDIYLDAVLIGNDNRDMKALSNVTGGCCFFPQTMSEGLKLFEMETVLSLSARDSVQKKPRVCTKRDLTRYSRESYDVQPQHKLPEDINKPVAPAHVILNKVTDDPPAGSKSAPPIRIKRILREISSYMSTPHQAIQIFPCENNIGFWRILLLGPADTPYENGVYSLYAEFPKDYPAVPPIVRFITPIYHCNVNASGRICHSVFDREYTSDTPITTILTCVFGLLITPEPDDPLDSTLAEEYFADKVLYDQKAGAHSRLHASKTIAEHQQEMLSSESREFEPLPSHLVCPLSKELFVDPVKTPHGHVYERYAIEAHLSKTSIDPVALKPLVEDQLVPCCDVKKLAEEYRSSRIKVDAWWQE